MDQLEVSVDVNATPARVWEALTQPEQVKQYFFGTDLQAEWKVGGTIFFRGSWEGKTYEDKGIIRELVPRQRLAYDYWSSFSGKPDREENYRRVVYTLQPHAGGTKLTVTQDGSETPESKAHSEENWRKVFGGLKTLVEGKTRKATKRPNDNPRGGEKTAR